MSATFEIQKDRMSEEEMKLLNMSYVNLSYGGHSYDVLVDKAEEERLISDKAYANSYSRMLVENMGQRSQLGIPNEAVADTIENLQQAISSPSRPCTENVTADRQNNHSLIASTGDFKWTHQLILLLIDNRGTMAEQFDNCRTRKKQLWSKVAEKMNLAARTFLTGDICDTKWRNLVGRYRKIKDKMRDSGEGNINWEYYEQVDEIMGRKTSSNPPPERIQASMAARESSFVEDTVPTEVQPSTSASSEASKCAKKAKLKRPSTEAPEWFKILEHQRREADRHQLEVENKRWEEQKDIENKKIDVENKKIELENRKLDAEIRKIEAFIEFSNVLKQQFSK